MPPAFHPVPRRSVQALVYGSPCRRWVKAADVITQHCVGPPEWLANSVLRASHLWCAARLRSIRCCAVRFRHWSMVRHAAVGSRRRLILPKTASGLLNGLRTAFCEQVTCGTPRGFTTGLFTCCVPSCAAPFGSGRGAWFAVPPLGLRNGLRTASCGQVTCDAPRGLTTGEIQLCGLFQYMVAPLVW